MALDVAKVAAVKREAWNDVAQWLAHTALEFVPDAYTQDYLMHVAECVSEEGELRYGAGRAVAGRSGLTRS